MRYVDHTYRDYSRYIENGGQLIKHKKSEKNFPAKVHKMISDQRHSNVITWMVRVVLASRFICIQYIRSRLHQQLLIGFSF